MKSACTTQFSFRRVSVAIADTDPLAWLANQPAAGGRVYWSARERNLEVAGLGAVHTVAGDFASGPAPIVDAVQAILSQSDPDLRFLGGMRFDAPRPDDATWAGFDGYWFVLPDIELVRDTNGTRLVANIREEDDAVVARDTLEHLAARLTGAGSLPDHDDAVCARLDTPDRAEWERRIRDALQAMDSHEIEKIVLARRTALTFGRELDPVNLLRRLRDVTRDCFHFCFQPRPDAAFIGASPERFYKREGRAIETEAMAGTRPRGASPVDDRRLGAELLASDKDQREHICVRDMIEAVLRPLCTELKVDSDPSLFRLTRGQHLFTDVSGRLRNQVGDSDLITALHPTPAVGGSPTPLARARIREWEAFDRGWYAAPVGWIGRDAAEFAVAIRSALCRGKSLSLYSGAGVVRGSSAAGEWDEIEHKIQNFVGVLGDAERLAP